MNNETHFEQVPLEEISEVLKLQSKKSSHNNDRGEGLAFLILPFDIFKMEDDGSVLWRGAAESVDEAKIMIAKLAANSAGNYLILSHKTGAKLLVNSKALAAAAI